MSPHVHGTDRRTVTESRMKRRLITLTEMTVACLSVCLSCVKVQPADGNKRMFRFEGTPTGGRPRAGVQS